MMKKKDSEIINFYTKIAPDKLVSYKPDKNFKNHLIEPCSNIMVIGGTGTGKTNAVLNFLGRKNDSFITVQIFTGSTKDEGLYEHLIKMNPNITITNDPAKLPTLTEYDNENKKYEKVYIFDDVSNINKKDEAKIKDFIKACRKYGFTCFFLYQTYTSAPKFVRDNCQIFWIFKLQSTISLDHILRDKRGNLDTTKENMHRMYEYATKDPLNFFNIDTKASQGQQFRKNFIEILHPSKFGSSITFD